MVKTNRRRAGGRTLERARSRARSSAERPGDRAGASGSRRRLKILVATDGSSFGRAAVRFAARLARTGAVSEVRLVLVGTARRNSIFSASGVPFPLTALPEMERWEKRWAMKTLEAARREFEGTGVVTRVHYVVPGDLAPASRAILREADQATADLIVLGSHGHGALREWALGSVASRIVHAATRPVVIVRPQRRRASGRRT